MEEHELAEGAESDVGLGTIAQAECGSEADLQSIATGWRELADQTALSIFPSR
jgi:hypothetical protein